MRKPTAKERRRASTAARSEHFRAELESRANYELASEFIDDAERNPGLNVLIVTRVSGRAQSGNLTNQLNGLRKRATWPGYNVVGTFKHIGQGHDPCWLEDARKLAKKLGANALFAATRCRLLRRESNLDDAPTREQFEALAKYTKGMQLLTFIDPEAVPHLNRSFLRKLGREESGNYGGSGKKSPETIAKEKASQPRECKKTREEKFAKVLYLDIMGKSTREIEEATGVPHKTAWRWLKEYWEDDSEVCHFSEDNSALTDTNTKKLA